MFNPLPLRLCCLAAMAPALTSEAATRTRDKLPGAPTSPHPSSPVVVNGRGCASPLLQTAVPDFQQNRQIISSKISLPILPKEFIQKKLIDTTLTTVGKHSPRNLGKITNKSSISSKDQTCRIRRNSDSLISNKDSTLPGKGMSQTDSVNRIDFTQTSSRVNSQNMPKTNNSPVNMPPLNTVSQPQTSLDNFADTSEQQMSTNSVKVGENSRIMANLSRKDGLSNGINTLSQKPLTPMSMAPVIHSTPFSIPTKVTNSEISKSHNNRQLPRDSAPTEVIIEETMKRQKELEIRADKIFRRIRRLQSRQGASHVRKQLSGFVDSQQKSLNNYSKTLKTAGGNGGSVDIKAELFGNRDVKNLSTAALVNLVHKLQSTQPVTLRQHLSACPTESGDSESKLKFDDDMCMDLERTSGHLHSNLHHLESTLDSDATESSSGGESCDEMEYDEDWEGKSRTMIHRRAEWKWAMDRAAVATRWTWLQAQVSDLEYRIRQQNDIYRQIRASKGAVVLGDPPQPEDLMSKSRNQRPGKRLSPLAEKIANLEKKNEMSPANISTLLSNVDKQSNRLTQQIGSLYSPVSGSSSSRTNVSTPKVPGGAPNGMVDHNTLSNCNSTPNTTVSSDADSTEHVAKKQRIEGQVMSFDPPSPANDSSCQAARCRPVRSYRKRKLLRTYGLHQLSRKAARLSTVKCQCYPPTVPCAMCGGRINNVCSLEPDVMPLSERVALLDPSFHPVLSFKQDIPLSIHFESLLKSGEWQQKSPPKPLKAATTERKRKVNKDRVRKYNKRIPRGATAALLSSANAIRKKNRLISASSRAQQRLQGSASTTQLHRTGKSISALSQSASTNSLKDMREALYRKRRGESAFDINNIVIPYSIASSTRVEKLQYKEILTPKWRKIDCCEESVKEKGNEEVIKKDLPSLDENTSENTSMKTEDIGIPGVTLVSSNKSVASDSDNPDDEEDLTDESYCARHLRSEIQEKKRFLTFANIQRRGRANRTESGCATPEPFSPDTSQSESQLTSQLVTPPDTPAAKGHLPVVVSEEYDESKSIQESTDRSRTSSVSFIKKEEYTERRRSNSASSRGDRQRSTSHSEERARNDTLNDAEEVEVKSWDLRVFPLSATDYELLYQEKPIAVVTEVNEEGKGVGTLGTPISDPPSPAPSSSSEILEDDPNDPEWTVIAEKTAQPLKSGGLVLKLAKR